MICIATLIVIVSVNPLNPNFWKLILKQPDFRTNWTVRNDTKTVFVGLNNVGFGVVEVTRVEVIYLPDETLGLIWVEQRSIDRDTIQYVSSNLEEGEQLAFLNLLLEGANKVRIEVETKTKIYTFYPQRFGEYTKPDSIEKK